MNETTCPTCGYMAAPPCCTRCATPIERHCPKCGALQERTKGGIWLCTGCSPNLAAALFGSKLGGGKAA